MSVPDPMVKVYGMANQQPYLVMLQVIFLVLVQIII